jgi:hypothetical protein
MAEKKKSGCFMKTVLMMALSAFLVMGFRSSFQRHFWNPFWKEHPKLDRWAGKKFKGLRKVTGKALNSARNALHREKPATRIRKDSARAWKAVRRLFRLLLSDAPPSRSRRLLHRRKRRALVRKRPPPPLPSVLPDNLTARAAEVWVQQAKKVFWKHRDYGRALRLWLLLEKRREKLSALQQRQLDLGLAWCYLEVATQPLVSAEQRFQVVLKHSPDNASARFGLALTWLRQGRKKEGLVGLRALLKRSPQGHFSKEARRILKTYGIGSGTGKIQKKP